MKRVLKCKFTYVILVIILIIGVFIFNNEIKIEEKNYNEFILEENVIEEIEIKEETKEEIPLKKVKVDIKGYVMNPGVYEVEEKAKVIDVINIAGGLNENADTSRINLAKTVKDEMVIIVYSKNEIESYINSQNKVEIKTEYVYVEKPCECPTVNNDVCLKEEDLSANEIPKKESKDEKNDELEEIKIVSINTATKEELMTLPSIGESKANNIIEYRNINKFTKIEEIKNVSGIGESLFEKIKDYITI